MKCTVISLRDIKSQIINMSPYLKEEVVDYDFQLFTTTDNYAYNVDKI